MATHAQNIENLRTAVYGEQVRTSMIQLFEEDYALVSAGIGIGTDVSSVSSSVTGYVDGNLYINSDTLDIWKTDGTSWQKVGNLKGIASITTTESTEDSGTNTVTITTTDGTTKTFNVKNGRGIKSITTTESTVDGGTNVITITLSDNTTKTLNVKNGKTGSQGVSVTDVVDKGDGKFAFKLSDNTETASTVQAIKGDTGATGAKGETGDKGDTGRGLTSITTIDSGKNHTLTANYSDGVSQVIATVKDGNDGSGTGDMTKATYDTNDNGMVDKAEALVDASTGTTIPAATVLNKADKATTLTGYGISDAYTKSQVNTYLDAKVNEPTTEGSAGYALITDGNGGRSWGQVASDALVKSVDTTEFDVDSAGKLSLDATLKAECDAVGIKAYDDHVKYVENDVVKFNGAYYKLNVGEVQNMSPSAYPDYWDAVSVDSLPLVTQKLPKSAPNKDKVGYVPTIQDDGTVEWAEGNQGGGGGVVNASCIFATDRWLRFDPSNHKGLIIKGGTKIRNSKGVYKEFKSDTKIDLTSSLTSNGADYFVFMADDGTITCSTSATVPSGNVKIGRFHTLCANVGTATMIAPPSGIAVGGKYLVKSYRADTDADFYNLYNMTVSASTTNYETMPHPLSGYALKDILPESVFCLSWHPDCLVDDAMVYDKDIDKCVDIYLQSGIGLNTRSKYNATHTVSRTAGNHASDFRMVGKKLLTDAEFESASIGSNQATNIVGSADKTTVGGHVDTANRRMISAIGCEEMCGYLWQWLDEISPSGGSAWATTDENGSFGQEYGTPYVLLGGGYWARSSGCGSRCRNSNYGRSVVVTHIGGRGLSHLKRGVS